MLKKVWAWSVATFLVQSWWFVALSFVGDQFEGSGFGFHGVHNDEVFGVAIILGALCSLIATGTFAVMERVFSPIVLVSLSAICGSWAMGSLAFQGVSTPTTTVLAIVSVLFALCVEVRTYREDVREPPLSVFAAALPLGIGVVLGGAILAYQRFHPRAA